MSNIVTMAGADNQGNSNSLDHLDSLDKTISLPTTEPALPQLEKAVNKLDYESVINSHVVILDQLELQNASTQQVEITYDLWAEFDKYANLETTICIPVVNLVNEGKIAVYTVIALTRALSIINNTFSNTDEATKTQQLLYFVKGCRLLLQKSKSKKEYEMLTDEEKAQYSKPGEKTKWVEHISETAPIVKNAIKKINNNQLITNLTELQTMLKNIKTPEFQVDNDEYIPIAKHITPGCKITKFDYDENSSKFLTLEISNTENAVVYRLEIVTDYDKVVAIVEWHYGDAEATKRVYKLCETTSGSKFDKFGGCYQMEMFYRKSMLESYDSDYPEISHDCTKFIGVPVVDMAVNYNTKSSEINSRFVEKQVVSHKFILGEVVVMDNHSGHIGNTLETLINFKGRLLQ
jgi:hypothetical protein